MKWSLQPFWGCFLESWVFTSNSSKHKIPIILSRRETLLCFEEILPFFKGEYWTIHFISFPLYWTILMISSSKEECSTCFKVLCGKPEKSPFLLFGSLSCVCPGSREEIQTPGTTYINKNLEKKHNKSSVNEKYCTHVGCLNSFINIYFFTCKRIMKPLIIKLCSDNLIPLLALEEWGWVAIKAVRACQFPLVNS